MQQPQSGRHPLGLIGTAVAMAVVLVYAVTARSLDEQPRDVAASDAVDVGAYEECTALVGRQLVDPAAATFPEPGQANFSRRGDTWLISSYVDAPNGLGALIRTNWSCSATATQRGWRGTATLVP